MTSIMVFFLGRTQNVKRKKNWKNEKISFTEYENDMKIIKHVYKTYDRHRHWGEGHKGYAGKRVSFCVCIWWGFFCV